MQHILNGLADGVVVTDADGRISSFNQAAECITAMSSDQVCGRTLAAIIDPENTDGDVAALSDPAHDGVVEVQMMLPDSDIRYVRFTIASLTSADGLAAGRVLTLQDITRIKKLQDQANRSGRLAAMGEMAVKIAHEIRNPLGSIELFASLLHKEPAADNDKKMIAEHISSGVRNINNIITNLLLFIRPEQQPEMQVVDIHTPLRDSLFFAEHQVNTNSSIDVVTCFAPHDLTIYGDFELLGQVALNLILNAIQAMPHGGQLTIASRKIKAACGREMAEIRFADTGCGIPQKNMDHIFDPFFTTKKRGTGLGLSIVHNITKAHGGSIDIKSLPEKGTECVVTFPLWQQTAACNGQSQTEPV